MSQKHLLVGNPSAQSGKAREAILRARALLEERGVEVVVVATEPAGRTPELVKRAIEAHRPDVVDCLGGDGTFNEVARGILESGAAVRMGIFPMGTANDQGRSFGLEPGAKHLERHVEVILGGHVTRLDAGWIEALEGRTVIAASMFFDSASFGLAPDILSLRNRDREGVSRIPLLRDLYRDQAVYVGAALDRFVSSFVEPTKFEAHIASESWDRTWPAVTDVVVKATPIFAGAWVLERECAPDDGLFEAIVVPNRRAWAVRIAADLAANPVRPPERERLSAAQFDLTFRRPGAEQIASQLDGEEWVRAERFRIDVRANVLPLLTPAEFVPTWRR